MSEEVSVAQMDSLIETMMKLRFEIEKQEDVLGDLNKQMSKLQAEATEKLKALGRKSYASPLGMVSIRETWRFNLPTNHADKKAMFTFFKEKGEEVLYDFATVNSNKYSAFCNAEWEIAKVEGHGMEYRGPGGSEPKLFETTVLKKR